MPSPPESGPTRAARIRALVTKCRGDPDRFNRVILGRGDYWARQRQVCRSVVDFPTTIVPTGNGVGKTFVDAGILHWFLYTIPGSMAVATAPTQVQLGEVLWKEVERAHTGSRVPLGGRLLKSPLKIDLGEGWETLAYSTNKVERFSGHHNRDLLAVMDEASGVSDEIYEAIDSLNPSRLLLTGNPIRGSGQFYERAEKAAAAADDPARLANVIRISSLESPDIDRPRSPRGMADASWLAKARNDYGEGSLWWRVHVLGLFPTEASDAVLPTDWLRLACLAVHLRAGPTRMGIDLSLGQGGDTTTIIVRDDNGILAHEGSSLWTLEQAATRAALLAQRWRVEPHRIAWDADGIGADFGNRLRAAGLVGCRAYKGGGAGNARVFNLRAAAYWAIRKRLDPGRMVPSTPGGTILVPQVPFAVPDELARRLRPELCGLRYALDEKGRIKLEPKEDLARRLGRSPDWADALSITFAFP